jgi:stage II sporulation protein AA (anti-sigma F factor antagonist)
VVHPIRAVSASIAFGAPARATRGLLAGVITLCNRERVDQKGALPVFAATAETDGNHLRVLVSGEVDMATADAMVRAATLDGASDITLDLRRVTFFDSAAIHAVLGLAQRHPTRLTVIPSHQVRRVLEIAGLGEQPWLSSG